MNNLNNNKLNQIMVNINNLLIILNSKLQKIIF